MSAPPALILPALPSWSSTGWRVEDIDTDEMILNVGPSIPRRTGVRAGAAHGRRGRARGTAPHRVPAPLLEKHAENVDYPGVIPYTDRMDDVASMGNSLGYALAVETLLKIEVSPYVDTSA